MTQDNQAAYEAVARSRGWETKRNDGSLNAGVVRWGRVGSGYQWVGSWREACALDGISPDQIERAYKDLAA